MTSVNCFDCFFYGDLQKIVDNLQHVFKQVKSVFGF